MATLLLIRHGQNDTLGKSLAGRLPGVHLNEVGKEQANRLGQVLKDLPIKAVYVSPLERAQETAQPIAKAHHLPVKVLSDLIEIDFGEWQGQEIKQLNQHKLWNQVQENPSSICFPDGESFHEAQKRIATGLTSLNEQFEDEDLVVCVAHGDVIRLAVAYFLGLPLDNFQRIKIAPATLTILHLRKNKVFFGPINYPMDFPEFRVDR